MKTEIARSDLLSMEAYGRERKTLRQNAVVMKKPRRIAVGPYATFHFENYQTMWLQVHEMLFIEKGGEAQIADELAAYNPLIPKGRELVATVMFEIDDPARRLALLMRIGNVERHMFLSVAGETIRGAPEGDVERTRSEDGKASSVHFVRFAFTPAQMARFNTQGTQVIAGIDHPEYSHMAVLPEAARQTLAQDFAVEA
jgi:hypothetical protein